MIQGLLGLIAGLLMLASGIGTWVVTGGMETRSVGLYAIWSLIPDLLVVIASLMLLSKSSLTQLWGFLVLVFSLEGLSEMRGFVIGPILGIAAGALALVRRPGGS